jgi:RNA polymerase sigma-70 factor (ECF subfamily)
MRKFRKRIKGYVFPVVLPCRISAFAGTTPTCKQRNPMDFKNLRTCVSLRSIPVSSLIFADASEIEHPCLQKKFDPNPVATYHNYQHLWCMNQEKIENLVERSKQHDMAAFRQLVETCQPFVFRLAFRLLCNDDEAKDIVQETFIRIWLHLDRYRNHARFSTWLYTIVCNLCYDRLRTMKRSPSHTDLSELNIPDDHDLEQSVINQNLKEWITVLTQDLSPKQRLVFTLKDIEGLELEDVEKITGMSRAKIKSNLYLARQYIRQRIEY